MAPEGGPLGVVIEDGEKRSSLPARRPGLRARLVDRMLRHVTHGTITVSLPDRSRLVRKGGPGPRAELTLANWRPLRRLVSGGDVGFAESYVDGDWATSDLTALIAFAIANEAPLASAFGGTPTARLLDRLRHAWRRNSRIGARRNIEAHYDIGNAFYASFLDPTMSYSSGLYAGRVTTLEAAQAAKQDRVIALAAPPAGGRVLEIDCGWGSLARRIAGECDCAVEAITLSAAQLAFARAQHADAAGSGALEFRLQDYRDVRGSFERIVSIEMLEAVGEAHWPVYFATLAARLAAGGRAVLQAITIEESRFEAYRRTPDFIQRHIFPGGMLPTVGLIRAQVAQAGLVLSHAEHFGTDYARTLAEWRRRFLASVAGTTHRGMGERFARKWEYYLAYCEAGFAAGSIDVGLYVLDKPA